MAQIFVSGVAHFFVVVGGSKIHERMAHFFIDIYNSLIETAQANDLSPKAYLHICLANLPSMDFRQHPEELLSLMPWSAYMQSCFKQDE